jgi:hypothetical protein
MHTDPCHKTKEQTAPPATKRSGVARSCAACVVLVGCCAGCNSLLDIAPPITCNDTNDDPQNCGQCGNTCAHGVICRAGACLTSTIHSDLYVTNVTDDRSPIPISPPPDSWRVAGVQINIPQSGWLASFGLAANYGGTHGYLALYHNSGQDGEPGSLIATTNEFTIAGDPSVASSPLVTTVPVDPPQYVSAGVYWLLGNWDNEVFFIRFGEAVAEDDACTQDCTLWYSRVDSAGPFEPTQPFVQLIYRPAPVLYAILLVN